MRDVRTAPECLAMVVHDHSKVGGWLLYLQQAKYCGQEPVADGCVLPARCL